MDINDENFKIPEISIKTYRFVLEEVLYFVYWRNLNSRL